MKTNRIGEKKLAFGLRRAVRTALLGALLVGCGGALGGSQSSGESHFLSHCVSSCEDGFDCISGVCTRGCVVGDDSCGDLPGDASCTDESIEPGAVAVCDVLCSSDADCAELGDSYGCETGFCRADSRGGSGGAASNAVFECPPGNVASDPIEIVRTRFRGDVFDVELAHGGGCAEHEYRLCYGPEFLESYPVQVALRLIHESNDDPCNAYLQQVVEFDLSPLAAAYNQAYQTQGGLISTSYGTYAFGQLSCEERSQGASAQVGNAMDWASKACQTAADCEWVSNSTSCAPGCGTIVGSAGFAELEVGIDAVESQVCGGDFEMVCGPIAVPPCVPPPSLDCIQGQCVAVEP